MLSFLPKDVGQHFFRSSRDRALSKYLEELGLSWEEMFKEDEPTAGDWVQFANGTLGGLPLRGQFGHHA